MTNSNLITEANLETRPKLEGGKRFVLDTEFHPAGDQPTAILELTKGISGELRSSWDSPRSSLTGASPSK